MCVLTSAQLEMRRADCQDEGCVAQEVQHSADGGWVVAGIIEVRIFF